MGSLHSKGDNDDKGRDVVVPVAFPTSWRKETEANSYNLGARFLHNNRIMLIQERSHGFDLWVDGQEGA